MEKLRELRDEACQRGQLSAAIKAECLRGKLGGFYVKQIATGDAGDFSRMTNAELEAFIYGNDKPAKSTKHRPGEGYPNLHPGSRSSLPSWHWARLA
jgi:hypothetical protein